MNNLEIAEICGRTVCLQGKRLKAYVALHKLGCPVFVREGDTVQHFFISSEDKESYLWCDYYGEFRGGYPYENPKIDEVLRPLGLGCDWENPSCMVAFND